MAAIPLLTLVDLLVRPSWAVWSIATACAVFVTMQARHVALAVRRTSAVLALVTATLLPMLPAPWAALEQGVRIGGVIASILVTVNLLSRAVSRLPRARTVMSSLFRVSPGSRYFSLSLASQFFGGLLGLAGIAMMMETAAQQDDFDHRAKLSSFSAIARGYAALSLWSPMYSNMSIVLGLYAGARWSAVLPVAVAVSGVFIVLGTLLDRMATRNAPIVCRHPLVTTRTLLLQGWPVLLGMLAFLALVMLASQAFGLPIAATILAGSPLAAWAVNAHLMGGHRPAWRRGARQVLHDMASFRMMSGEVMMFVTSGCAGTVVAAAIPASWITAVSALNGGSTVLACLVLSAAIVLLSVTAIHPMLSAVIVGSSLGPTQLGLPLLVHLSAVLVGWGLAIIVTPYSVLSTMANRWSGIPILVISVRANAVFVLLALGVSASLLGVLARLIGP